MTVTKRGTLASVGGLLLLCALMVAPLLLNRSPILYLDTNAYVSAGKAIVDRVVHEAAAANPEAVGGGTAVADESGRKAVRGFHAERSIIFGTFVRSFQRVGGLTLVVCVQALWCALCLFMLLRLLPYGRRSQSVLGVAVIAFTPLPFFVMIAIPDAFAGTMAIGLALFLAQETRLSRPDKLFWGANIAAGALFHNALALVGVMTSCAWLLLSFLQDRSKPSPWRGAMIAFVAAAAMFAYPKLAERALHQPDVTPPFLLGRMIGDGTAIKVLATDCAAERWLTCRYAHAAPLSENDFLWGGNVRRAAPIPGYSSLSVADQVAVKREQGEIVKRMVRRYGLEQAGIAGVNSAKQFVDLSLDEFEQTDLQIRYFEGVMPATGERAKRSVLRHHPGVLPLLSTLYTLTYLTSIATILAGAVRRRSNAAAGADDWMVPVGLCLLLFAACNAILCGGFAGVFGRYQARLAWPLCFVALVLATGWFRRAGENAAPATAG